MLGDLYKRGRKQVREEILKAVFTPLAPKQPGVDRAKAAQQHRPTNSTAKGEQGK